jgi:hypothetical protein
MSFVSILGYFMLFIIIFAVLALSVQYYMGSKKNKIVLDTEYPPADYMLNKGLLCPDWWDASVQNNQVTCTNSRNLVVNSKGQNCYSGSGSNSVTFPLITNWPITSKSELETRLKSRCEWIDQCGSTQNTKGSWMALNNVCPLLSF